MRAKVIRQKDVNGKPVFDVAIRGDAREGIILYCENKEGATKLAEQINEISFGCDVVSFGTLMRDVI